MSNARNLARLLPDSSGKIQLPSQVAGVLPKANAVSGSVLQVVNTVKTDANVLSYGTALWSAVSGLSATITPISASSKILVLLNVGMQGSGGASVSRGRVTRGGTVLSVGDASSLRPRSIGQIYHYVPSSSEGGFTQGFISTSFFDSPNSTSPQTYQFEIGGDSGGTVYVNRTQNDRDNAYFDSRSISTLTLMEIAA